MNYILKVAYFLHFPVGVKNKKFYIKDLLNDYFKNISITTETTIVGSYVDKEFYHNILITDNVNHNFLNANDNRNIFKKIFQISKIVNENDVCFLFMPCKSSVLVGLICYIKNKKFVTYFGNDWEDLELTKKHPRRIKVILKRKVSLFLSRNSIFSLYTGAGILGKHQGKSKYLTTPIVNISLDTFHHPQSYPVLSSKKNINLLFVGGLDKRKGVDILLNSINLIEDIVINLDLVGDGKNRLEYESLAETLNENININFHGFIKNGPELYNFYKKADVFILPSFSEGLPRVLYEAMSHGCPVITTPVNSVPFLFTNNKDCLFIEPGNVYDTKVKIQRLIEEDGLNQKLAKEAFKTITPIFSESASSQHNRLFNEYYK
jgi:glycosyltransferase involved in cell wall biosynthesis